MKLSLIIDGEVIRTAEWTHKHGFDADMANYRNKIGLKKKRTSRKWNGINRWSKLAVPTALLIGAILPDRTRLIVACKWPSNSPIDCEPIWTSLCPLTPCPALGANEFVLDKLRESVRLRVQCVCIISRLWKWKRCRGITTPQLALAPSTVVLPFNMFA